jgi:2-oxoglutarate dehydrogenase E1 component
MDTNSSWPGSLNSGFADVMYEAYLADPSSVPDDWRTLFEASAADSGHVGPAQLGPTFRPASLFNPPSARHANGHAGPAPAAVLQDRVDQLIRAYRVRGHLAAQIDPLGLKRPDPPELDPGFHRFGDADLDRSFSTTSMRGEGALTLRQICGKLRNTYCRSIGVQFMHIDNLAVKNWLQHRMEESENHIRLDRKRQVEILTRLTDAVVFEDFIQKKFVGAKSFSLEGAETLIPLLHMAIDKAGDDGAAEIVLAMAHRGRLNVLANIMGKSPRAIFAEFEDKNPDAYRGGRGDVKYHLGFNGEWTSPAGKKVHLSLCFNPSHLEIVNPVALGRMRAKMQRYQDPGHDRGLVILIHGDASFAGEGVVQETLNLSELDGYSVGGAIHVVVNNQIGFTTSPTESRSCPYATDVARMLQVPIFHVNGEDPEAVAQVVTLALDFRRTFKRDVVIDMYCYRRRGHNEGDEPSFTQPLLYKAIDKRKSVREGYLQHLLNLGGITREEADDLAARRRQDLEDELAAVRENGFAPTPTSQGGYWQGYFGGPEKNAGDAPTGVEIARLQTLLESQTLVPASFKPHPKIERLLKARAEMARGQKPLDWSAAEALAFATLAVEGYPVRLSGQDSGRGTFSQRHAVLHDFENGAVYVPLQHLEPGQAAVEILNSPLSETGVLGFDYGFSLDLPEGLVLWEAQFGDFVNVAQPIIDQFIVSAEDKWHRLSGITLLLPHGFEGMGPEHSSARLERFLAQGADDNIQVVVPSTPSQYFHVLRRQVVRRWRKPLVVMTPKSLLRHPEAVSDLQELATGRFHGAFLSAKPAAGKPCTRVLLCSGKISYEIEAKRKELGRDDVAVVRVEQLYPFPETELKRILVPLGEHTPLFWVQEEPENMGAWRYVLAHTEGRLFGSMPLVRVSRPAAASPASGSAAAHKIEQDEILAAALATQRP